MNMTFYARKSAPALGALTLFGGAVTAAPVPAVQAAADKTVADTPVTLTLTPTSLPNALRTLFKSVGVTHYTIAPEVQGRASLAVQDVPLGTALGALLRSASPPAAFTVENGVYTVTRKPAEAAPTPNAAAAPSVAAARTTASRTAAAGTTTTGTAGHTFDVIPVNKYDAYMIAALTGGQGITPIPSNDVITVPQPSMGQGNGGQGYGGQNGQGYGAQNRQQNRQQTGGFGGRGGRGGGRGRRNRGYGG